MLSKGTLRFAYSRKWSASRRSGCRRVSSFTRTEDGGSNLALSFQRKFQSALNRRYSLWSSLSTNASNKDAWKDIEYTFTRNEPKDIKEQAETANILKGITSEETALSVISVIPDVQAEMEKIKKEEASTAIFDKDKQPSENETDAAVSETNEE